MKTCQRVIFLVGAEHIRDELLEGFICLLKRFLRFDFDNDDSIPLRWPDVEGEVASGSVPEHRKVPASVLGDVCRIACKLGEIMRNRVEGRKLFSRVLQR